MFQALACLDHTIAKILFHLFFDAICNYYKDERRRDNPVIELGKCLTNVLSRCGKDSSLASTLMICASKLPCHIQPIKITELAIRTHNMFSGITLLESMLAYEEDEKEAIPKERPRKKVKRESKEDPKITTKDKVTAQLAALYKSL